MMLLASIADVALKLALAALIVGAAALVTLAVRDLTREPLRWLMLSSVGVRAALAIVLLLGVLNVGLLVFDREHRAAGGAVALSARGLDVRAEALLDGGGPGKDAWFADQFGPRVSVGSLTPVSVYESDPTIGQWVGGGFVVISRYLSLVVGLWCTSQLLTQALGGNVFTIRNVRLLQSMAFLLVVAGPVAGVIQRRTVQSVFSLQSDGPMFAPDWSWWPLVAALALLAIAQVWQYGVALQRDAEGTV